MMRLGEKRNNADAEPFAPLFSLLAGIALALLFWFVWGDAAGAAFVGGLSAALSMTMLTARLVKRNMAGIAEGCKHIEKVNITRFTDRVVLRYPMKFEMTREVMFAIAQKAASSAVSLTKVTVIDLEEEEPAEYDITEKAAQGQSIEESVPEGCVAGMVTVEGDLSPELGSARLLFIYSVCGVELMLPRKFAKPSKRRTADHFIDRLLDETLNFESSLRS